MKTPEQLMTEWDVHPGNVHLLTCDVLTQLIAASMQVGVTNLHERVMAGRDEGIDCEGCDRWAKRYPRTFHSSMAQWLIELVKLYKGEFVSTKEVFAKIKGRGSDASGYSLLRHWGLIEPMSEKGSEARKAGEAGLWRPTQLGIDFVYAKAAIYEIAYIYNNICESFGGKQVTIHQALGKKFDYDEMMGNKP